MKALTLVLTLACPLLASCSAEPGDAKNPHDFKYTAVESGGETCILDTATRLLWQAKSSEIGLHDAANTYSWYDPDEANGELDYRGLEDGGVCQGSRCDTWHYVQAVNLAGLCGYQDWRMPSKDEIFSLSDYRRVDTPPTINTDFFPNSKAAEYWTANDYSFQWNAAWAWNFELGHDRVDWKKEPKYVRLVRGTAGPLESVKE